MTFPIYVEAQNGHFIASLVGVPGLSVAESTREQALTALRAVIQQHIEQGDLVSLEMDMIGVSSLAGKYKDDPTLRDICEEAYQLRDADRQ
jgi:predicted RNase H-like HicB family nuclease